MVIAAYPLVREGLKSLVQHNADLRVVGEARFVSEALPALQAGPPDVVLMGLDQLREADAISDEIRQVTPLARVLVVGETGDDPRVVNALAAGAGGYVLRDLSADEMGHAIRAAQAGLLVLGSAAAEVLLSRLRPLSAADSLEPLTERENQVLELLVRGLGNRQIASELGITEHTVKFHIATILSKLRAANRTEAVSIALQNGLVTL